MLRLTSISGNIGKARRESKASLEDLITPTIKSENYSTGRGGTGNMAKNDPARPEIARASQDVVAAEPRERDGVKHFGRGGAANVEKVGNENK